MSGPPPFPWLFPYKEDPSAAGRYPDASGRQVLRPVVDVKPLGPDEMEQRVWALVDSGSEHTLASPFVARGTRADLSKAAWHTTLGIGGDNLRVRFLEMRLRLYAPSGGEDNYVEWETEVGFVNEWRAPWQVLLGQIGFFDRFTVTAQRHARALAIEDFEAFDDRFGMQIRDAGP